MRIPFPILVIILSALPICGSAQSNLLDSLYSRLTAATGAADSVKLMNSIAYELCYTDSDSSIRLSETALILSARSKDDKGKADALNNLGVANHIRGSYDLALKHYTISLELRRSLGDSAGTAGLLNNMASIYALKGNYPLALENYQNSLDLKLKLGNRKGAATSYNNIGNIHYYQKKYDLALEYYQKALEIDTDLSNTMGQARSLGNVGLVHLETGRASEALQYYLLAYEKMDSLHLECQKMYAANGLGQSYFQLNDISNAHRYLDEAYTEASQCNDPVIISSSLETLGKVSIVNQQNTLAEKRLLESYRVARDNNLKVQVKDASQTLYEFYKTRGRLADALRFLEVNKVMTDSILNQDLTEQLTRMEMNALFKQEKDSLQFQREKEILSYNAEISRRQMVQSSTFAVLVLACVLLFIIYRFYRLKNKANRQLSEKNTIISRALKEKDVLLKEIHHRVKNNLQIVSSLLSIQSKMVKDEVARQAIRDSQARVHSMSLVHQNLYSGGEVAEIQTDIYLYQLIHAIRESFDPSNRYQLNVNLEPALLPSDTAMNLGLIANELLTNAYKHAFSNGTSKKAQISISLANADGLLCMRVADNGSGIRASARSFGLELIEALSKSINGELISENENGTTFTLKISYPHGSAADR